REAEFTVVEAKVVLVHAFLALPEGRETLCGILRCFDKGLGEVGIKGSKIARKTIKSKQARGNENQNESLRSQASAKP
ncbi:hypothetical protein Tco_0771415, partial [Tanacetum coccineum]